MDFVSKSLKDQLFLIVKFILILMDVKNAPKIITKKAENVLPLLRKCQDVLFKEKIFVLNATRVKSCIQLKKDALKILMKITVLFMVILNATNAKEVIILIQITFSDIFLIMTKLLIIPKPEIFYYQLSMNE